MVERCIQGLDSLPQAVRGCVLTVGNFDGVHRGHRRILRTARTLAGAAGLPVVALTFDPPPDLVLRPSDPPRRITPHAQKLGLLLAAGTDWVVTARSDQGLLDMTPDQFVEEILLRRFAPAHVVEGPDFFFGRGREGDVKFLQAAGKEKHFRVRIVESVRAELADGVREVSSTLIRELVMAGRVTDAAQALGRDFALYGPVVPGAGQGRVLAFPTVNLAAGEQVIPADGVYAGRAAVGESSFLSAISIGTKPTLGPGPRTIEANLIDAEGDFYDRLVELQFVSRLREQQRFDGIETLRKQIAEDVQRVREICG